MTQAPEMADLLAEAELKVAIAHHQAGRLGEARGHYEAVLKLRPDTVPALRNLAVIALGEGRTGEGETFLREAVRLEPDDATGRYNLGTLFKEQGRLDEALEMLGAAARLRPGHAPSLNNLGSVFLELRRFTEALSWFERALSADSSFAEAWHNRGLALIELGRTAAAVDAFERAEALFPGGSICHLIQARSLLCDWSHDKRDMATLAEVMRRGEDRNIPPFVLLTLSDDPALQLACARRWASLWPPAGGPPARLAESGPGQDGRLRIGYLSGDFRDHAVAFLMVEMMERHDHSRFRINAYSLGPDDGGETRRRLLAAFDGFTDLSGVSSAEGAAAIAADGIDILVDLAGYTGLSRSGIPALRPAPVQVNFLGYPGTMGARFIDYVIADPVVAPMADQPFFDERIVHLPDCYQPNDTKRPIGERTPTRAEAGLPERGFVFCCFNTPSKIRPAMFDVWADILGGTEDSVLWLLGGKPEVQDNLRREAERRGVAPARLVFAPKRPLADHLARHRLADLFLDTLPYNAHTTASDALWAGLPVLTCKGRTFAGRVAASLLGAARLPELVTRSLDEYRDMALSLARRPRDLAALRLRLNEERDTLPLFDTDRFTRAIEAAYRRMWEIHLAGEKPQAFAVGER